MKVQNLISYFEEIAPQSFQESYDNSGLITGHPDFEITGVLTCLDATEAVLDEAILLNCNVVVAHHPIVFRGLKKINGYSYVERVLIKAIKNDIAIFAIHTNLDNVYYNGVNMVIAQKLGLSDLEILAPTKGLNHLEMPVGAGLIGTLAAPIAENACMEWLKTQMKLQHIRHTAFCNRAVQKIAVCGGAGSFLLPQAIAKGANLFVTGDFKYHEFFDAEGKIIIADIGHYESEQFTIEHLKSLIIQNFSIFAVHSTTVNTNPVLYS
jgi:dinuclear metal center YbgI/SA1388 family protein